VTPIPLSTSGRADQTRKGWHVVIGKTIEDLRVGERAEFTKTISESDVYLYAGVTGDLNPAHINEEYAKKTFFKTRIAHGMLLGGLVSAVLGNRLPGPGTVYIRQNMEFLAPVHIGDTITASVEVMEILQKVRRVKLRTKCVEQHGTTVLDGEALVSPPKKPKA
jgi:3-hydroxybutyryl-CoA dehydratase